MAASWSKAPTGDARATSNRVSRGTNLVSKMEHRMLPRDEITLTCLLVILAIAVTVWWRIALRLVAVLIMVILALGTIHLAVFLGIAR